ncbi:MAG: hypothetical protein ABIO70_30095 [Pseudomonadota bacterium]
MRTLLPPGALALFLIFQLAGCDGDPILVRADDERAEEGDARRPAASPGVLPQPGVAPEPQPGQAAEPGEGFPDEPTPGIPEPPTPGDPSQPPPPGGVDPGSPPSAPRTTVSGVVRYPGYTQGPIRVDVFDGDQRDLARHPGVVAWADLPAPGPFTVQVPKSAKKVWISAYNDANGNGRPDDRDPRGYDEGAPVGVAAGDVTGVIIELKYDPQPVE